MTLHQLRILAAVAEYGGVTRAAERLHLTQPTLSIQLRQLAESVGEDVVETVGRRLLLTDVGHEVLLAARGIDAELTNLKSRLAARRGVIEGRLHVTVVSTAEYFMPRLVGRFQQAHPAVAVTLQVLNRADVLRRVSEHMDDAYLMTRPPEDTAFRAEAVGKNPLIVIAAPEHPWARRRRIPSRELATQPFVVREVGSGTRLWTDDWFRSRGLAVHARLELGSNEAVKQAVRGGFGIAVLSAHTILLEHEHRLIVPLHVSGFPLPSKWHLVTRAGRSLSPVAQAFRRFLIREAMPEATRAVAEIGG
ncbi:MAG: LysR family transcriptional regulator [Cyanobacteria bacterium]|nr:LysR family transcriptional regulator [Cyanobacteriota bacterium]